MSSSYVSSAHASLTANGASNGLATVTSNAAFKVGAVVWIRSSTVAGRHCIVTDLVSTNQVGLRFYSNNGTSRDSFPNYGRSDLSAYLLADGATISQEAGIVPVIP
jgi:hypothetical protein